MKSIFLFGLLGVLILQSCCENPITDWDCKNNFQLREVEQFEFKKNGLLFNDLEKIKISPISGERTYGRCSELSSVEKSFPSITLTYQVNETDRFVLRFTSLSDSNLVRVNEGFYANDRSENYDIYYETSLVVEKELLPSGWIKLNTVIKADEYEIKLKQVLLRRNEKEEKCQNNSLAENELVENAPSGILG